MRILLFLALYLPFQVLAECGQSSVLFQEFFATPLGKEGRTVNASEIDQILAAINKLPAEQIEMADVLVCTSAIPLPPISKTDRPTADEHVSLAKLRAERLEKEIKKQPYKSHVSHQVCGPEFDTQDWNLRFISKESGKLFDEKLDSLFNDKKLLEQLDKHALMESVKEQAVKYPTIFQQKYQPFQGYRVIVIGKTPCGKDKSLSEPKKPSSKIQ